MLKIKLTIPRRQKEYVYYSGKAKKFINMPIIFNENVVGSITDIISDVDEYIEVEGLLYEAGVDYFSNNDNKGMYPASITIK